ncbi:hypothetical protein CJ030_MR1G028356 [Morella rubra]|uniref:TMV resistance protein N n=1 Tax=Morella rubra TaxID=262757 RepID=A0A6A1WKD9_9ROSI|nr:hypothetical protein CJ030_MR1G028356 [Morella rubra]
MLILEECTNLVELHESIEHLQELVFLNLKGCTDLRYLPSNISTLKSLERLNLSGCLNVDKLPEKLGNMMASKELSSSSSPLKNSKSFLRIPKTFLRAPVLGFRPLGRLILKLAVLFLQGCSKLVEIQGLVLDSNSSINLHGCDNLSSDFKASLLQSTRCNREVSSLGMRFQIGLSIKNWIFNFLTFAFSFRGKDLHDICGVYSCKAFDPWGPTFNVIIHNKTRGYSEAFLPAGLVFLPINDSEDMFLFRWQVVRNKMVVRRLSGLKFVEIIRNGDEIEVSFVLGIGTEAKKCGVHLVVDEPKVVDIHASADQQYVIDDTF